MPPITCWAHDRTNLYTAALHSSNLIHLSSAGISWNYLHWKQSTCARCYLYSPLLLCPWDVLCLVAHCYGFQGVHSIQFNALPFFFTASDAIQKVFSFFSCVLCTLEQCFDSIGDLCLLSGDYSVTADIWKKMISKWTYLARSTCWAELRSCPDPLSQPAMPTAPKHSRISCLQSVFLATLMTHLQWSGLDLV